MVMERPAQAQSSVEIAHTSKGAAVTVKLYQFNLPPTLAPADEMFTQVHADDSPMPYEEIEGIKLARSAAIVYAGAVVELARTGVPCVYDEATVAKCLNFYLKAMHESKSSDNPNAS
jgi:hypothetical protein